MLPSFANSFDFGCGCPCGTVTALIIASLSVFSVTLGVVAGSTEIATVPFVTVGIALSASVSLPFKSAFADNNSSKAPSTSVCSASSSANIVFAAPNFLLYSFLLSSPVLSPSSVEFL